MSKKHRTEEAFYQRLRNLSDISNTSVNETKRTLGTLIDFKRGTDKVAYGIVKENHHYYIKKSNSQDTPTIADFAYIGGLGNITEYQYKSLAEADKQRNMVLVTINEALGGKPVLAEEKTKEKQLLSEEKGEVPTFEKGVKPDFGKGKKKEDKEEDKKEDKEEKKEDKKEKKEDKEEKEEDKEKVDEGAEEDLEKSAQAAAELDVAVEKEKEVPAPVADIEVDAEIPVPDPDVAPDSDVAPDAEEVPDAGGDIDIDAVIDEPAPEGGEEGGEEMPLAPEDGDVDVEVGDDEENNREIEKVIGKLTDKIRKTEMTPSQTQSYLNSLLTSFEEKLPELEVEERKEMANKLLKIVPDEEIADIDVSAEEEMAETKSCDECGFAKYVSERGHNAESMGTCPNAEMANLMSGYIMNKGDEMGDEDYEDMSVFSNDDIQKSLYEEYGHMNVGDKMKPFTDKINEDEANPEAKTKKIEGMFWWEIDPQKEKKTELVAEEVVDETLNGKDPAAIEVQPNLNEEENEEEAEVDLDVDVKPEAEVEPEVSVEVEPEVDVLDITKHEKPEMEMIQGFETMGAGIPKPDGAPTSVDVNVDAENKTVNVTMNESEKKLRKYIRARLEEKAGLRKPMLNEDKKSAKIKKLDTMIDGQIELFESIMGEGGFRDKISTGMEKASQWIEGAFAKQKKINQMLPTLKTGEAVNQLFDEIFGSKISGGMSKYATRTGADEKLAILQQAAQDPNGLGKIRLDGNLLTYVPVNPQDTKGSSGFALGRSRLGQ